MGASRGRAKQQKHEVGMLLGAGGANSEPFPYEGRMSVRTLGQLGGRPPLTRSLRATATYAIAAHRHRLLTLPNLSVGPWHIPPPHTHSHSRPAPPHLPHPDPGPPTCMWMSASSSQLRSNSSASSGLYWIFCTRLSWLRALGVCLSIMKPVAMASSTGTLLGSWGEGEGGRVTFMDYLRSEEGGGREGGKEVGFTFMIIEGVKA